MVTWWLIYILLLGILHSGNFQYFELPNQNTTFVPLPYQNALGLSSTASQRELSYTQGFPTYPVSSGFNQPNLNPYYAQQGWPLSMYSGLLYPFPGYPQTIYNQPSTFPGAFGPPSSGYPIGFDRPSGVGYLQPQLGHSEIDQNANIKTEILDVSPEYQRQVLGWSNESQGSSRNKPRYTVDVNTQTSNITEMPTNLSKPIIREKQFITSIKRTFVYDSSKPENITPINIHIVNGQQVTTTEPPTTTENENVAETTRSTSTIKPSGRRFMDVPKTCPTGTMLAHNGECIEPFLLRNPSKKVVGDIR